MKSIPTIYKDIRFRSRLEARWAAMFDLLGWSWEYEPEIEDLYIPDFLLHGLGGRRVFVEVKPLDILLGNVSGVVGKASSLAGEEFLILVDQFIPSMCLNTLSIGFIAEFVDHDKFRDIDGLDKANLFHPGSMLNGMGYDFAGDYGSWAGRLTGVYDGNNIFEGTLVSKPDLLRLWSKAGNAIQWMPGAPTTGARP